MWVACKKMKIKRNGNNVEIVPGDPIPEAGSWKNPGPWVRQKFIKQVPDPVSVEVKTDLGLVKPVAEEPKEEEDIITVSL